ncbi:hypothetical protein HELRODRAFT_193255 [Helobdella robusta]|uniref:TMC domain-containing protein n=1 Tax=Helobdella robusta TaxID=6412 RepID=T1FUS9_HELRO|nr:hypothetical protein HELRODRAFT_193255 [Helobdella robusta]ESN97620.1 hypothetical protein HELRODRAFT_193255 [Helobdella robusta]
MDDLPDLPSNIAKTWGARTLRSRKYSLESIDGKKREVSGINLDLVDIDESEDVRSRATRKYGFTIFSFFSFVWWLFLVNLFTTALIVLFLILPQSLMSSRNFLEDDMCKNASSYECKNSCLTMNMTIEQPMKPCLDFRTCYYTEQYEKKIEANSNTSQLWAVVSFLQGAGWMERTFFFIGSYTNKSSPIFYNMEVAVLLVVAIYFLLFLVSMVYSSSSLIRQRMMSDKKLVQLSGDTFPSFLLADKVFSGWDFTIAETSRAISKKYQLKTFFTDMYIEYTKFGMKKPLLLARLRLWAVRLAINVIVVALIVASLAAIVISITKQEQIMTDDVKRNQALKLLCSFTPALTVAFLTTLMPFIFSKLVTREKYSAENKVNMVIIRSISLYLASVITLVVSIAGRMVCDHQPCDRDILCWETYIGQELYKLSLVDICIEIVGFLLQCVRKRLYVTYPNNRLCKLVGNQTFNVPKNIIEFIYMQAMCWLGILVAPGLSIMNTFKILLLFFLKFLTLIWNCRPKEEKRASKTNYFFVINLLATFFICACFNAFVVGRVLPSPSCGPYREYSRPDDFMSRRISSGIDDYLSAPLRTLVLFFGSWMFFIVVAIILGLSVLYYQSIIAGNKMLTKNLRDQLSSMQNDNQIYKKELQSLK